MIYDLLIYDYLYHSEAKLMRLWYFSSSVNSSSNVHALPSSQATCLIFGQTLRLLPYFMCANSEALVRLGRCTGSPEPWLVACDKYHNLMSWLI